MYTVWHVDEHKITFKLLNPFYYQLMHITLQNAELLKHSKLD